MRKKLSEDYNLAICFPEIAKEWHPTKNGKMRPEHFYPKSAKKVWWICKNKHEFFSRIDNRINGKYCKYFSNRAVGFGNDLQTNFPEIAKEWHPTKNGNVLPSDVLPG